MRCFPIQRTLQNCVMNVTVRRYSGVSPQSKEILHHEIATCASTLTVKHLLFLDSKPLATITIYVIYNKWLLTSFKTN